VDEQQDGVEADSDERSGHLHIVGEERDQACKGELVRHVRQLEIR